MRKSACEDEWLIDYLSIVIVVLVWALWRKLRGTDRSASALHFSQFYCFNIDFFISFSLSLVDTKWFVEWPSDRERGSGGYTRSNWSSSYCLRYGLIYLMRKGESTLWRMQCFSWLPLQPRNSRRRSAKRKLRRAMSLAQRSASLSNFYREMW